MRENVEILDVFHDGSIVEIRGTLPTIMLSIEIPYLRNMFPGEGNSFWVKIFGCESIEFYNWEEGTRTKDLNSIQSEEPEILSVEQKGDIEQITCTKGEVEILYREMDFQLDSGDGVSFKELADGCSRYWNRPR